MSQIEMSLKSRFSDVLLDRLSHWKSGEPMSAAEFQNLLEPLQSGLYNFILKTVGFSDEAGDLFQETILRAFKYRSGFRLDASFKSWLFAIAHNEMKAFFKRRKRTAAGVEQLGLQENLADAALVRDIYEAAGELPHPSREVFFLHYYNRFKISEISGITGLSAGNIKYILNRCRHKIRSKLGVSDE